MEKSISFYECKYCGENLFVLKIDQQNKIVLFDNCIIYYKSVKCAYCRKEITQLERTYNPRMRSSLFIKLISDFALNNKNINKELKKILKEFLKQKIYSKLKEINT